MVGLHHLSPLTLPAAADQLPPSSLQLGPAPAEERVTAVDLRSQSERKPGVNLSGVIFF